MTPRIDFVAALDDTVWLLVGLIGLDEGSAGCGYVGDAPAQMRALSLRGRDGPLDVVALTTESRQPRPDSISLRCGRVDLAIDHEELATATVDLQTVVRTVFAPLPAEARASVVGFLASAAPERAAPALVRRLVEVRDALRERLASSVIRADNPIGLAVEFVLAVDRNRFFIQGWFRDALAPVVSLRVVSPEGAAVELLDQVYRFRRADLESLYGLGVGDPDAGTGFACCFDLPALSSAPEGWVVELRDCAGSSVECPGPAVITNRDEVRNRLLGDIELERPGEDALIRGHVHPALSRLQALNAGRVRIDRVAEFGEQVANPDVSIVVPLYRRIDFMEHQLAQFALDSELAEADLVYVLDSPELARDAAIRAADLFELYRVPFRLVTLSQNVGFAGANEAGVRVARGRLLLFLNSDVLPARPGWLRRMASSYDVNPHIGALAPKLVYEDESIQHAGMYFRRLAGSRAWINEHYFKGMHAGIAQAATSRAVPAVTAACMLIDKVTFNRVGGFNATFVRGDFEDSDLCLRLREIGRESWYCADVTMYHLEGQSYESALRRNTWRYNAWLHTEMWNDVITRTMRAFSRKNVRPIPAPEVEPREVSVL